MPRVKRGTVRRAKRKKILARAKGFFQTKSKLYRSAKESVDTALKYAFVGRRRKKRDFRRLWIVRINAAAREHGLSYSAFIQGLEAAGVTLDRKMLADLAAREPKAFAVLAEQAKAARPAPASRRLAHPPWTTRTGTTSGRRSRPSSPRSRRRRDLQSLRDRYLGRKGGRISGLYAELATVTAEKKRELGARLNRLKARVEGALDRYAEQLASSAPPPPRLDPTLAGRRPVVGHIHPLTYLRTRIEAYFAAAGYEILDGPETEDDYHNFEALNLPADHPARDMQDTLYLEKPWTATGVPGRSRPAAPSGAAATAAVTRRRATSAPRRCCGRTRRRCRSATWSGTSRRCGSSVPAASIAATTSIRRTRRCSSRSKAWWSAKA